MKIELAFPEKTGFFVRKIDGLGPPKASINNTNYSTMDGALHNSARVQTRNIVLSLGFMSVPSIEAVRLKSYRFFPIKKEITLAIETDSRVLKTSGFVESNEPDIFSSEEGTQISVICADPYFYSDGADGNNTTVFYGTIPQFEFPFSNDSLTDKLIQFGTTEMKTENTVFYSGDVNTGVKITIHAVGKASGITIYNVTTRESMYINTQKLETLTGTGLTEGDEIIINTVRGEKSIKLLRNGEYINIFSCLGKDADWFELTKGDNLFVYKATEGVRNLQLKIENRILYEGV